MKTRMDKYYDNHESSVRTRVSKNERLYKEINDVDLNKFNPNNNARVIGDNDDNVIDVDKIRNLLEKNYKKSVPKRKTLTVDNIEENVEITDEPTKEYDINSILEKAREEKDVDYNKERLKKLHNTQLDILNSLEFEKKEDPVKSAKEDELMSLINTITLKESEKTTSIDPLDILSDLKGGDNTQVLSGIEEEIKKSETQRLIKSEKEDLKNSFYTTSNVFTESDFDDFNDLKNEMKGTRIVIKILITLIVIIFVVGAIILLNNYFNIF
ncbi:MAG: hypothetical protein E7158_05750 [Firmicutes bacterium]|nr:hypothetical protein [Bacillota bacterium]